MFGSSARSTHHYSHARSHGGGTYRSNRIRGLRGAINNPRTTHAGRREAKFELRSMGAKPNHPSLGTRLRHFFHLPAKHHTTRTRRY
ncbi:hypothetical protein Q5752_001714 [Cryptotrichosporon argae]